MAFQEDDRFDDEDPDEDGPYRPGWLTIIISLIVLVALLATLIIPVIRAGQRRHSVPTSTPNVLLEAWGVDQNEGWASLGRV